MTLTIDDDFFESNLVGEGWQSAKEFSIMNTLTFLNECAFNSTLASVLEMGISDRLADFSGRSTNHFERETCYKMRAVFALKSVIYEGDFSSACAKLVCELSGEKSIH